MDLINDRILTKSVDDYSEAQMDMLINNLAAFIKIVLIKTKHDLTDGTKDKAFKTVLSISKRDSCREGSLEILSGLLNTMGKDQVGHISSRVMDIIESTIKATGDKQYEDICVRMATGLIQDLTNCLRDDVNVYLGRIMNLLFYILEDPKSSTAIKTLAIIATGDLCLVSKH